MARKLSPASDLTAAALKRLVKMRGSAGRFKDPRTGRVFSGRAVRSVKVQGAGFAARYDVGGNAGRKLPRDVAMKLYRVLSQGEADAEASPSPAVLSARLARGSLNNFDSLVESYRERRYQVTGKRPTKAQALGARSKFWRALDDLEHAPRERKVKGRNQPVGPKSKAARALVDLGLREEESTARVGESPKATPRQMIERIFRPSRGRV